MTVLKSYLKNDAPSWLRRALFDAYERVALFLEFRADRRRYRRYSAPDDWAATPSMSARNIEAQLTKDYHRVEKGLALAEPKKPFGIAVRRRLDYLIPSAPQEAFREYAITARAALNEWNESGAWSTEISPRATTTHDRLASPEVFFNSRHSVRDFADQPVDIDLLSRATELAIHTPSVCNRQSWMVRYLTSQPLIQSALRHQNGNAGMQVVPALALITVDSRLFTGPTERNQGFIEGGLFAMSLGWAVHALGLDSVMLNLSISRQRMARLRAALDIPDHELVIMMMAIGQGRNGHRVARSPRRDVAEVMSWLG